MLMAITRGRVCNIYFENYSLCCLIKYHQFSNLLSDKFINKKILAGKMNLYFFQTFNYCFRNIIKYSVTFNNDVHCQKCCFMDHVMFYTHVLQIMSSTFDHAGFYDFLKPSSYLLTIVKFIFIATLNEEEGLSMQSHYT